MSIEAGDFIDALDASGEWHSGIAATGVQATHKRIDGRMTKVHDFPVIWVSLAHPMPEQGREEVLIPWPAEAVRLYDVLAEGT